MADEWYQSSKDVQGVLLDITGVLYNSSDDGGVVIPGSVEAVNRLKSSGVQVRFCTNETMCTRQALVTKLNKLGFDIKIEEVFSPIPAACHLLRSESLKPHLLVHSDAVADFGDLASSTAPPTCVVIADCGSDFTYDNLNDAFRVLMNMEKPNLISLGRGKYYKDDGQLKLDVGAFMRALEYACGCEATVVGKPAKSFFKTALSGMGVTPDKAIMVGDDIVNDVGGAQACGIRGLQVRTGKYRPSDEPHPEVKPAGYVDNLAQAVDLLLSNR
ncbi:phospholysine phosphohistidine inorganic pyrophosphate phosphatase-like [Anneissia japonica]|uniref:phospholysine phosphohistidine inorganic pyrophosphate phosphatase-like n=1 Tax=Anneissia japonica TaxID=1529436 RepID=UPI001425958C|nr:phospholysine phosphohistidine inorganic pyrophosphate phosphatase-like [Anneissia japonica]